MIQEYVMPHTTNGSVGSPINIPADGSLSQSSSAEGVSIWCGGPVPAGPYRFVVTNVFDILGPDDHVFSFSVGTDARYDVSTFIMAEVSYLNADGNVVHTLPVNLAGGVGCYVRDGCFSVPTFQRLGAVSIRVSVPVSLSCQHDVTLGFVLDLRYASPRKLLQYGK